MLATEGFKRGEQAIKTLNKRYRGEEVRDQIEFLMSIYRSATLLFWTLNELNSLRRQQNWSDKVVNIIINRITIKHHILSVIF